MSICVFCITLRANALSNLEEDVTEEQRGSKSPLDTNSNEEAISEWQGTIGDGESRSQGI